MVTPSPLNFLLAPVVIVTVPWREDIIKIILMKCPKKETLCYDDLEKVMKVKLCIFFFNSVNPDPIILVIWLCDLDVMHA